MSRLDKVLCMALPSLLVVTGACAQSVQAPSPPPSDVSRQGGSLSEKLNTTGGVISPEGGIDPGMQKVPPAMGTMPVVPPPGTQGGRSDVVPK